jgi:hypothetical protein
MHSISLISLEYSANINVWFAGFPYLCGNHQIIGWFFSELFSPQVGVHIAVSRKERLRTSNAFFLYDATVNTNAVMDDTPKDLVRFVDTSIYLIVMNIQGFVPSGWISTVLKFRVTCQLDESPQSWIFRATCLPDESPRDVLVEMKTRLVLCVQ